MGLINCIQVCLHEFCCISNVHVCFKWTAGQSDMLSPLPLPVQRAAVAGLQTEPDRSGMQCGFLSVIKAYKDTKHWCLPQHHWE